MHKNIIDCLVIGAGIVGLLTARELVAAGLSVTLIERGEIGQESSWAGGGILSSLHPWRSDPAITALSSFSQEKYPRLASVLTQQTGIDPEWTASGLLVLDVQDKAMARAWAQQHAVELSEIDAQEIARLAPALREPLSSALWLPGIAQIRNPRLLRALSADVEIRGVRLERNRSVTNILTRGNRVYGVDTSAGKLYAPHVIVASGAWSGELLRFLEPALDVQPVKGQMLLIKAVPGVLSSIVLQHDHYLIPRRDGRILIGSTVEYAGFDKSTNAEARGALLDFAHHVAPQLKQFPVELQWAGLRPGTRSGIPFIGPHPKYPGLYLNTGHFRNGLVMAPASAHLLRDLITGKIPSINPAPYQLTMI